MSVVDVRVQGVTKEFRLGTHRSADRFRALDDVSFDVERGTTFGIIGPNGAGKSTLLRLLAGITPPTHGRIAISGRLAALIEVGSGFHPELTGRENVFLSGSILGLRRREIAALLDRIAAFAGVEAFLDVPVKWYSSGMYVRLGFAVAAHMTPDVLLVDEVLAVGDAEFQIRCLGRIEELRRQGVTVVFISHDLTTVRQVCDRALLLERGRVTYEGQPAAVVERYHAHIVGADDAPGPPLQAHGGSPQVTSLTVHAPDGTPAVTVATGAALQVHVHWRSGCPFSGAVAVHVHASDGRTRLATLRADTSAAAGAHRLVFEVPALPLLGGTYYLTAVMANAGDGRVLAWWDGGTTLRVAGGAAHDHGGLMIPYRSRVDGAAHG